MPPLLAFLHRVMARQDLSAADARAAMDIILGGEASTTQIGAFLVALRMKGETANELTGFAQAMRSHSTPVDLGSMGRPLLDTCGTGGDGGGTFNVSTVAAFVVAGAGIPVAKHGNRSLSSRCGSADLLEELGVKAALDPAFARQSIEQAGLCFLFAPAIHTAMKHAQPARAELKTRTVFNLLGPLTNPAGAQLQLIGAPSLHAAELMAQALSQLGTEAAMVVHGSDGMDEITTTGATFAFEVRGSAVKPVTLYPEQFGVETADRRALVGGDRQKNAAIARAVLTGEKGAARDIVLVNAGAAICLAGKAAGHREAVGVAAQCIDSGAAHSCLTRLAAIG